MGLIDLLRTDPVGFVILAAVLLYSVIAHEIAHGWVAYLFGDTTAKYAGRLTLDPRSHIDPMGALALVLVGFGWAKPVPVNFYRLRNFRVGLFCVSLAGIATNILIATVALFILQLNIISPHSRLFLIALQFAQVNIVLGAFNLIPIPPLDGSKLLMAFLPEEQQASLMRFEQFGFIVLLVLLFTRVLDPVIAAIQNYILYFIGIFIR
jgi:Zn-dependent protease